MGNFSKNFTCYGLLASQISIQIATYLIISLFTVAEVVSFTKDHKITNLCGYIVLVVPLIVFSVGIQTSSTKILNLFTHYIYIIILFIISYIVYISKCLFGKDYTMKTSTSIELVVYLFAIFILILYYFAAKGFAIRTVESNIEENKYRVDEEGNEYIIDEKEREERNMIEKLHFPN